jgi:hypothetical protein
MSVRKRARSFPIAVAASAITAISSVGHGQDLQRQEAALAMISKTANDICQSAPLEATNQGVNLSGEASAKLGGLVGKVADLGISGAGQYQTARSFGVLQKDLISALQSGNDCKLEVFRKLVKVFFVPETGPAPPVRTTPAPNPNPDTKPRQKEGWSMLCGRQVRYVINATAVAESYTQFLGVWTGAAWNSRICGGLVVEGVRNNGAALVRYVYGPLPNKNAPWKAQEPSASIRDGRLSFTDEEGGEFTFMLAGPNTLSGQFISAEGFRLQASFNREPSSVP